MDWIYNNIRLLFHIITSIYGILLFTDKFIFNEKTATRSFKTIMSNNKGVQGKSLITGPMHFLYTDFIDAAKYSLKMEVFTLKSVNVMNSIIKAFNRGVKVTIITDFNFGLLCNPHIKKLIHEGIEIYCKPGDTASLMHNKFIITDEKFLCVTSMDPTEQAMCGSFNNFIFTDNKILLDAFLNQFSYLKSESMKINISFYREIPEFDC